jgi:hypothetical protein
MDMLYLFALPFWNYSSSKSLPFKNASANSLKSLTTTNFQFIQSRTKILTCISIGPSVKSREWPQSTSKKSWSKNIKMLIKFCTEILNLSKFCFLFFGRCCTIQAGSKTSRILSILTLLKKSYLIILRSKPIKTRIQSSYLIPVSWSNV